MEKFTNPMKEIYKKYYLIIGVIISYSFIFLFNSYLFRTTPGLTAPTLIFWGFFGANIVATVFFLRNSKARMKVRKEMQRYWKLIGGVSVLTFGGVVLWFFAISQGSLPF